MLKKLKSSLDCKFKELEQYLTLKNRLLLKKDSMQKSIKTYMLDSYKYFIFVEDNKYKEIVQKDYEDYKYYIKNNELPDGITSDKFHYMLSHPYEDFPFSDKRIPDKYKPYIGIEGAYIRPRIPVPESMKKEIINQIFILKKTIIHTPVANIETYGKISNEQYLKQNEIEQMYLNIINKE